MRRQRGVTVRAKIPCTVRRHEGDRRWHLPVVPDLRERGSMAPVPVHCGAMGALTGLAVGTEGLDICDACVDVVRRLSSS